MCSDGLSGLVKDAVMLEAVTRVNRLEDACRLLVTMANEAGGTDNITVLLIRIHEEVAKTEEPAPVVETAAPAEEPEPDQEAAPTAEVQEPAAEEEVTAPAISVSEMDEDEALALFEEVDQPPADAAEPDRTKHVLQRICPACSHDVANGEVFCGNCGASVD
jgi:protein phosphatase